MQAESEPDGEESSLQEEMSDAASEDVNWSESEKEDWSESEEDGENWSESSVNLSETQLAWSEDASTPPHSTGISEGKHLFSLYLGDEIILKS